MACVKPQNRKMRDKVKTLYIHLKIIYCVLIINLLIYGVGIWLCYSTLTGARTSIFGGETCETNLIIKQDERYENLNVSKPVEKEYISSRNRRAFPADRDFGSKSRTESENIMEYCAAYHSYCKETNRGDPGPPGPKGSRGDKGEHGSNGDKGNMGQEGRPGRAGSNGRDGSPGRKGNPGPPGPRGQKGDKGTYGSQGISGPSGQTGPAGPPGKSIKGETGPRGMRGLIGFPGLKAEKGEKGDRGSMGLKGDLGPMGNPGLRGDKGMRGEKGDRGRRVRGYTGQTGPRGERGFPGSKGEKGDRGIRGMPGNGLNCTCPKGEKGEKGQRGLIGFTGYKGEKGDTGLKGNKGYGERGHKGNEGRPGQKGIKGERGDDMFSTTEAKDLKQEFNRPSTNRHGRTPYSTKKDIFTTTITTTTTASTTITKEPSPTIAPRTRECLIRMIGIPLYVRKAGGSVGSWMKDATDGRRYWSTEGLYGNTLSEFRTTRSFKDNTVDNTYYLRYFHYYGNNHVIYKDSFFYHWAGRYIILKFELKTAVVSSAVEIREAAHNNSMFLYKNGNSYFDIEADENGLWVIYRREDDLNHTYVLKIDPNTMTKLKTWRLDVHPGTYGNSFVICGIVYFIKDTHRKLTVIDYAYDLYKDKEIQLKKPLRFRNPYGANSMVSYVPNKNPRNGRLYGWDNGRQISYQMLM